MAAEDPVVRSSRREALFALGLWVAALAWTVAVCYFYGYLRSPDDFTYVLWFPDWVFWGIVAPWCFCILFSTWFAFRYMGDEPLGEEQPADALERARGG